MEIDKAYTELIELYPGLKKPGCWINSDGDVFLIPNMDAQYIQNVMNELNKQFKTYCTRNDGEFVGKCAEAIKKKLDELQKAVPNNTIEPKIVIGMTKKIRRIAGRKDCGNCYRLFEPFETVHYLGIDNCSYCADCREKLRPGEKDDPLDQGGWVLALYVGFNEEGRENILQLIKLWNENNNESYNWDNQIGVTKYKE